MKNRYIVSAFMAFLLSYQGIVAQNTTVVIDFSSSTQAVTDTVVAQSYQDLELDFAKGIVESPALSTHWGITAFAGQWRNMGKPGLNRLQAKVLLGRLGKAGQRVKQGKVEDGSAIYNALFGASVLLAGRQGPRSILLLTDGSDNRSAISAQLLIRWLQEKGIRVDAVGFAGEDSVFHRMADQWVAMPAEQRFDAIEQIAQATGGIFLRVKKQEDIQQAHALIVESIQQGYRPTEQPSPDYIDGRMKEWLTNRLMSEEAASF